MNSRNVLVLASTIVAVFVYGAARAAEVKEFACHALPLDKEAAPGADFSVSHLGESDVVVVPLPPNKEKNMVVCLRSQLALSPNDGKIIDAGFTFWIGTPDGRMASLLGERPNLMLVEIEGKFTKSELKKMWKTLKVINESKRPKT